MNNAVQYMQGLTDPNPKYLLLATDGEPNCAARDDVNANDAVGAENAVAAANTAGFPTFVVGIATTTDAAATNALNTMAVNGGEAQTGAATQYYAVTDTAGLVTVLAQIIGKAASWHHPADRRERQPRQGRCLRQGRLRQHDRDHAGPVNGWSYTDANKTAIILNGTPATISRAWTYTGFQFIYTCATGIIMIG